VDQSNLGTKITIARAADDRRAATLCVAPYLTDEGFVLFDRRETAERRQQPFAAASQLRQIPTGRQESGE
jgi:hypothetical protein